MPVSGTDFPDVVELVPHAGSMVLLTRVTRHEGDETVCAARIGQGDLLASPTGDVPAWMGLEYMAQCIAAHAGLVGRASGEAPRVGFLLGTRRVTFHVPCYRRGQRLDVRARRLWGASRGMVSFDCRIDDTDTGAILAEGRLNCFVPPDDPTGEEGA
jgi:predicted hotdog family 3-hydroxylacyl-ACP dehydratase